MDFQSELYQITDAIDAFPPYIFKFNHDFGFDKWKPKVDQYLDDVDELTRVNNLDDPEEGGGSTSIHFNYDNRDMQKFSWYGTNKKFGYIHKYGLPSQWKELEEFYEHLSLILDRIQAEWGSRPEWRRFCCENWINRHPKDAWTKEHHHQNAAFATVAYLELPPDSGFLEVRNPLEIYKKGETLDGSYWTQEKNWGQVECVTGDVLVFPGWLSHRTQKNLTDQNRYVLSSNFQFASKDPTEVWESEKQPKQEPKIDFMTGSYV